MEKQENPTLRTRLTQDSKIPKKDKVKRSADMNICIVITYTICHLNQACSADRIVTALLLLYTLSKILYIAIEDDNYHCDYRDAV